MTQVAMPMRRAARSSPMDGLARFGLAARAFIYLVIGWLGLQIALGNSSHQANQRGALAEVAQGGIGLVLLWFLGFGLAAYSIWRFSLAVFGSAVEGDRKGARAQSAVRGLVYGALCVSTFAFIAGASNTTQKREQQTWTARVMHHDFGRWLVGGVGAVIAVIGLVLIYQGITRQFEEQLRMPEMSGRTRKVVVWIGAIGTAARGAVFAVSGALIIAAAVTYDPKKSSGLDGAMHTLAAQPYGPWLLSALSLGLIAFGIFGFAAARWARTR
jgi:hypothetical protein